MDWVHVTKRLVLTNPASLLNLAYTLFYFYIMILSPDDISGIFLLCRLKQKTDLELILDPALLLMDIFSILYTVCYIPFSI